MKIQKKIGTALAAAGLAIIPGVATAATVVGSYSYYECRFGQCQLITCTIYEEEGPFQSTTQTYEICSSGIGGGGIGGS